MSTVKSNENIFYKNLIMTEEEEQFQSSNTCWICEKLIDDDNEKVRDHLRGYNSHLFFYELNIVGKGVHTPPSKIPPF